MIEPSMRGMPAVGFGGGMLDAIGGGWLGPDRHLDPGRGGHVPRYVIGSVNLTEFFVTVVTSVTLILSLGARRPRARDPAGPRRAGECAVRRLSGEDHLRPRC